MPRKRRTKRNMHGKGIKEVIEKVKNFGRKAHDFVKKHRLISKGLAAVTPFAGALSPLTTGASAGAAALGYGRKRRVGRPRKKRRT